MTPFYIVDRYIITKNEFSSTWEKFPAPIFRHTTFVPVIPPFFPSYRRRAVSRRPRHPAEKRGDGKKQWRGKKPAITFFLQQTKT